MLAICLPGAQLGINLLRRFFLRNTKRKMCYFFTFIDDDLEAEGLYMDSDLQELLKRI